MKYSDVIERLERLIRGYDCMYDECEMRARNALGTYPNRSTPYWHGCKHTYEFVREDLEMLVSDMKGEEDV